MPLSIAQSIDEIRAPLAFSPPERERIRPGNRELGWRPQQRMKYGYYTPEEWYQSILEKLVKSDTQWVDIGGGQHVFPQNKQLAAILSERCELLVGVDPSDNILNNEAVHERVQSTLEELNDETRYDLATLRMVAEHVTDPAGFLAALATIVKPGGHVVLLTPYKWSAVSILARLIPSSLHTACVRLLTPKREERHVFPTFFRLNTRADLKRRFVAAGFEEVFFERIADCSVFHRFKTGTRLELALFRLCQKLHVTYPETNIVAVFRRRDNVL